MDEAGAREREQAAGDVATGERGHSADGKFASDDGRSLENLAAPTGRGAPVGLREPLRAWAAAPRRRRRRRRRAARRRARSPRRARRSAPSSPRRARAERARGRARRPAGRGGVTRRATARALDG